MIPDITKPAHNEEIRTFEWRRPDGSGQLNDVATLASTTLVCSEAVSGTDVSANMIAQVAVYNQTQTRYQLKAGTKNQLYNLEFRCVDSNGQKLADTLTLKIT
ncbi:MAG: hypothetical protein H7Y05_12790 [Steroidobacteraceae bacterium]|nr:hypothetical protein [Deltaproteobacteria bacterium]